MTISLEHLETVTGYLAYKNFVVDKLTNLTDKLTDQIKIAKKTPQPEQGEKIEEINATKDQIYHVYSHFKYLCAQVRQIEPSILYQIRSLIDIIRQDRASHHIPQPLDTLLEQVNIHLYELPLIEQAELALLVHLAYREKKIVQTSVQFGVLFKNIKKLNQVVTIPINKKRKIN